MFAMGIGRTREDTKELVLGQLGNRWSMETIAMLSSAHRL
jgi:hypothetical protein